MTGRRHFFYFHYLSQTDADLSITDKKKLITERKSEENNKKNLW